MPHVRSLTRSIPASIHTRRDKRGWSRPKTSGALVSICTLSLMSSLRIASARSESRGSDNGPATEEDTFKKGAGFIKVWLITEPGREAVFLDATAGELTDGDQLSFETYQRSVVQHLRSLLDTSRSNVIKSKEYEVIRSLFQIDLDPEAYSLSFVSSDRGGEDVSPTQDSREASASQGGRGDEWEQEGDRLSEELGKTTEDHQSH